MQEGKRCGESCTAKKEAEKKVTKKQQKAFIIGGGTSAKAILDNDILCSKMREYTVMGCNKAVEHIDCDIMVIHDHGNFINGRFRNILDKFDGSGGIYAPATSNTDFQNAKGVTYLKRSATASYDFNKGVFAGGNCGCFALSIAVTLGFKEIYLIGMDARYNMAEDRSHFHDGYNNKISEGNERVYEAFATFFENSGKALKRKKPKVNVFNVSDISLIDIDEDYFKRISIEDALNG